MNINNVILQYANEILANLKCIQQVDQSESQSRSREILTNQRAILESPSDMRTALLKRKCPHFQDIQEWTRPSVGLKDHDDAAKKKK